MRFLFLNQYAPGDPAPPARLLDELADYLRIRGHAVEFISQAQEYHGRPARGGGRMRREVKAVLSIAWSGWRRKGEPVDIVLATSSPPGLVAVAALVAWRQRATLAHWAMDLYPELAVALGEIGEQSILRRGVQFVMGRAYRRSALTVALDEDMRTHLQERYKIKVRVLPPWPARRTLETLAAMTPEAAAFPEKEWSWLYSGNLGRAHEWRTLLDAQRVLEDRGLPITLIFQGDGAARDAAQGYARELGLRNCHWKGYAAAEDLLATLLAARALIVTQRPATKGLLWPSKLALLERLPRPILWVGPVEGDIARGLAKRGEAGIFAPNDAQGVAAWIENVYGSQRVWAGPAADGAILEASCAAWERWFHEVNGPSFCQVRSGL